MYLVLFPDLSSVLELTEPYSNQRYNAVIAFLDYVCGNGEVYRPTEERALANIRNENRQKHLEYEQFRESRSTPEQVEQDRRAVNEQIVDWLVTEMLDEDGRMMCKQDRGGYFRSASPRHILVMLYLDGYVWVQTAHIKEAQRQIRQAQSDQNP